MKSDFLERVLKSATVHHETEGTRIEYDKASFYLTAEFNAFYDKFTYSVYDADDIEQKLKDDQTTIVYKFVKGLHDTEKQKQEDHQAQF